MMGRDEVRVDGEPQYPEAVVEVVLPDRCVPLRQGLRAPDVVDEYVDVAVVVPCSLRQGFHLVGLQMVDRDGDTCATEVSHELGRLFDRLGTVVVGLDSSGSTGATCADDRCASFAQRSSDSPPGTSGCACDDGHAAAQCISRRRPGHVRVWQVDFDLPTSRRHTGVGPAGALRAS